MHFESPTPGPSSANYREYFAELCRELPPLPGEDAEARALRLKSAMDAVVALNPDNAFEARLAVRVVSADGHAADALRSAALAADDADAVRRCRAQAASMARTSDAALRGLQRMQSTRDRQLAAMHPAAMGRAGYWFKEVSVPAPARDPAPAPEPRQAEPEAEPVHDIAAEADMYAIMYPGRVARIRAAGGLPANLDFGPPEPELVEAILHGTAPRLRALSVPQHATPSHEIVR